MVGSFNYFGLILETNIIFNEHYDDILQKVMQRLFSFKEIKWRLCEERSPENALHQSSRKYSLLVWTFRGKEAKVSPQK